MITLPPYEKDRTLYHKLPAKDRWIFNKLEICERFGYGPYGPCGTPMPAGTYCVRPIINLLGMAHGGFFKKIVKDGGYVNMSGYMWTQWETGNRTWVEYVDDKVSSANVQVAWDENMQVERFMELPADKANPMPDILKGISRYMLVEYLGNVVIDIGPRHLSEEPKESIIRDYRKYDPMYELEFHKDKIGYYPVYMKRIQYENKGYGWEELDVFAPRKIYQ